MLGGTAVNTSITSKYRMVLSTSETEFVATA